MAEEQQFHWSEGMKFVAEGIKGIFLLNGAATIAVLSFVGNTQLNSRFLVFAMVIYSFGALMGPVSFLFAYLTQLRYGNAQFDRAWAMHKWTYGVVILGFALFVVATTLAACGILSGLEAKV
ncbi:hypothetical protein [Celeribacter baekdonensis]|uniref:hypothetical protein n=1 Tax=Celeribacter baekdonensis TaxID=875171 RepID=UPI003A94773D